MATGDRAPTLQHDEETAPPPGMYWVQMQGLWALRPIVDLDPSQLSRTAGQHTESWATSATEQGASWTDQQRLAQSGGAACCAAAATAGTPLASEGGTRLERLARTQGVIGALGNHAQLSQRHGGTEGAEGNEMIARVQYQAQTQTLPPPPPQQQPEQQHQGWPEWFLQWAHRVKDLPDQAPGPSAPPSAPTTPPSPPGTPQRSTVKSGLTHGPTLTAPEATPLAQGEPLRWP